MPAPSGTHKFEFTFNSLRGNTPMQSGKLIKTIDLPPNHSIRLNIVPAALPYSNPKDWTQRMTNENAPEIEIIATVEPNPDPDEDKPCEIPKN
ncbi:hypothetical protein EHQ97_07235 [Leptospira adleri]|nr:hypothetical protein EHQ97_07235 [Leptospira adleri]